MKKYIYDIPTYSIYDMSKLKKDLSKVLDIIETINRVINNLENDGSIKSSNILDAIQVQPRIIYITNSGTNEEKIIKLNELKLYYEGLRDEYLKEVARAYEENTHHIIESIKDIDIKRCYDGFDYLIAIDGKPVEDSDTVYTDNVVEIGENKYKKLTNSTVWYDENTKAMIITSDCEFSKNYITQIKTTLNNGQILYVPKQTYGVLIDNKIHDGTKVIFDFKEDNSVEISDGKSKLTISGKEISYEDIDNTYKQVKEAMDFTLREMEKGFKKAQTVRDKYINTLKYADNIMKEIQQMNKELSDDIHSI